MQDSISKRSAHLIVLMVGYLCFVTDCLSFGNLDLQNFSLLLEGLIKSSVHTLRYGVESQTLVCKVGSLVTMPAVEFSGSDFLFFAISIALD